MNRIAHFYETCSYAHQSVDRPRRPPPARRCYDNIENAIVDTVIQGILVAWLLIAIPCIAAAQNRQYPPQLEDARTEVYKSIGHVDLKVWIFMPEVHQVKDRRAAIVFFFGGGWTGGSPAQFAPHSRYLADQGIVAIAADYRVRRRHGTTADKCVADGKSAVRWIRQNADRLGIDPKRIAAGGGSAGGHVAACTGVIPGFDDSAQPTPVSSVPNALVLFNPALMLAPIEGVALDDQRARRLRLLATRTGVKPERISPIHHIRAGLPPTIIFHGDQDTTVPHASVKAYAQLAQGAGNRCELATYPGYGHGFFNFGRGGNPGEAYRLTVHRMHRFLQSLGYLDGDPAIAVPKSASVHLRAHMNHSREKFERGQRAVVAFIGGSITEMDDHGHSGMVETFLREHFPETDFKFVNAGISSTCSTTGAFRLTRDVLSQKPDLLFVEFAVNDDQDAAHGMQQCLRGMEGIVRQARLENRKLDIVITHFANPSMLETIDQGAMPVSIEAHERVARHYGVNSVNLAAELKQRISAGTMTWQQYGGVHPAEPGNRLAADLIIDLLTAAWSDQPTSASPHSLPKPVDSASYFDGRLIEPAAANYDSAWTLGAPEWNKIDGQLRDRFANQALLCADAVGAEAKLSFRGRGVGISVLAGPDAGVLEYSIDNTQPQVVDLYHRFSRNLHYPRTIMLADELNPGEHQVSIRIGKRESGDNGASAVRILNFVVN